MQQFKCVFSVQYQNTPPEVAEIEHVIYAEDLSELQRKALKVFVNDQIEDETGLLDNAISVNLLRFHSLE